MFPNAPPSYLKPVNQPIRHTQIVEPQKNPEDLFEDFDVLDALDAFENIQPMEMDGNLNNMQKEPEIKPLEDIFDDFEEILVETKSMTPIESPKSKKSPLKAISPIKQASPARRKSPKVTKFGMRPFPPMDTQSNDSNPIEITPRQPVAFEISDSPIQIVSPIIQSTASQMLPEKPFERPFQQPFQQPLQQDISSTPPLPFNFRKQPYNTHQILPQSPPHEAPPTNSELGFAFTAEPSPTNVRLELPEPLPEPRPLGPMYQTMRIPGPAGNLPPISEQDRQALLQSRTAVVKLPKTSLEKRIQNQFDREYGYLFEKDPWTSVLQQFQSNRTSLSRLDDVNTKFKLTNSLVLLKSWKVEDGFGYGMFIDPTGKVEGVVVKKVIDDHSLSEGCILHLQNVSIFLP